MKVIKVLCLYSVINLGFIACSDDNDDDEKKTPKKEDEKSYDFIATITETDKPTVCTEIKAATKELQDSYKVLITAKYKTNQKTVTYGLEKSACEDKIDNFAKTGECKTATATDKFLVLVKDTDTNKLTEPQEKNVKDSELLQNIKASYVYGGEEALLTALEAQCEGTKSNWKAIEAAKTEAAE